MAYRGAYVEMLDAAQLDAIRQAVNRGLVLGSERFKDQTEAAMQRRTPPGTARKRT